MKTGSKQRKVKVEEGVRELYDHILFIYVWSSHLNCK